MKAILLLVLTFLLSCQVPGDTTVDQKIPGDSFRIYLTSDIAINSCLLSWQKLETYTLLAAVNGELDIFQNPFSDLIPKSERARSFSFKATDQMTGNEQLIPMETIVLQGMEKGFKLVQESPFDGSEIVCGYVKMEDLLRLSPTDAKQLLQMYLNYKRLPVFNKKIGGSEIYTASMLLLDTLQKNLAYQAEVKKAYSCLDEDLNKMNDSLFRERIQQLEDSLGTDGMVYAKHVRIPEFDLWKGFLVYGTMSATELSWNAIGLLYHPNTKYGSFNPGNMLWFAVPSDELSDRDPEMHQFLTMIAKNALLYSADPSGYTSQYFLNNSIPIDNGRYPGMR